MATRDEVIAAIRNADAAGDSASVRKLGAFLQTMQPEIAPTAPDPSMGERIKQGAGDLAAGAVRGAGSIGATLLELAKTGNPATGGAAPSTFKERLSDRRTGMDAGLTEMGADPNSLAFKAGKLGGEIAGTAGVGGALANGMRAVPVVAKYAPGLVEAVQTSGMTAGAAKAGIPGTLANLATRTAGGAVTGGTSAALVDPEKAGTGALIGAAMPGALKLAGVAGKTLGKIVRGPEQAPEMAAAVQAARSAGYVIPPTQANPTLANRLLEGVSGKSSIAQNASAANQAVTNRKAAAALGLAPDVKLTPEVLADVRKTAGATYDAVSNSGTVVPGQAYSDALDKIAAPALKAAQGFPNAKASPVIDLVESLRSPSFDAGSAVAKLKELRSAADDAFRAGNTDVARASKAAASALETALGSHLAQSGNPQALQAFQEARQLIAKTYSVEKALNPASGSVDARKLAAQLAKGKPLSGELKSAAEFAARFMGSLPQTSPLGWMAGAGMSAAIANPLWLAAVAARPAARALTLSDLVQNRLVQQPPGKLSGLLASPAGQQALYRAAPVALSDR
jgi:hypothetical protein